MATSSAFSKLLYSLLFTACLSPLASMSKADDVLARRPLEHQDYDVWNTMSRFQLSRDGGWVAYTVQNGASDAPAKLHIHNLKTGGEFSVTRASGLQFTYDSRFAIFRVLPDPKQAAGSGKGSASDASRPKVQILELATGATTSLVGVQSFRLPEENSEWIACQMESPKSDAELSSSKPAKREIYEVTGSGLVRPEKRLKLKSREELKRERGELAEQIREKPAKAEKEPDETEEEDSKDKKDDKTKRAGNPLVLLNLNTRIQRTFPNVSTYAFTKQGQRLAFVTSLEKPKPTKDDSGEPTVKPVDGIHVFELSTLDLTTIADGAGEYRGLAFSEDGKLLAFASNRDDYAAKTPSWSVYLWKARGKLAKKIADEHAVGIPVGWWIAPGSSQRFSEDARRLFFDTAPVPESVLQQREAASGGKDVATKDDKPKAKLDIWHWQDPQLQPQQLLQASVERNRDYRAVYNLKSRKVCQLGTRNVPSVSIDYRSTADIAVANTNRRYQKMLSWDIPGYQDAYLVNLDTGERELAIEKVKWSVSLSPEGKYLTWFDSEQQAWFAKAVSPDSEVVEISAGIEHPLYDELHDTPSLPRSYGTGGWLEGDQALLIYDAYDIWMLDPTGQTDPVCITLGQGRENDIQFRYRRLDREERAIAPGSTLLLEAFNRKSKASGYYELTLASSANTSSAPSDEPSSKEASEEDVVTEELSDDGQAAGATVEHAEQPLRRLLMLDEALAGLQKAENNDRVVFTRSTFRDCPDLWASSLAFEKVQRVSDINPQQDHYTWGTAELVHWDGRDGESLDGILLKPDGFDPSKQYPMMVYFYERNSDNLHSYYTPAAGRSIICHSFYVSRGYLVFIPDIPYKTGEPGPSAANSILPGVEHLIAQGFVDKDRIGMQGHSWGGYQTAYLVTQTDLFACAESGAPVSNMTSAYGGIRWGSGMSRMFQYERTQSRIGEDLWAARDKYIANSPLFFADKINTPLLILHNDEDGAVPWYQGIELFVALRRLEKPAWMLNYNGNPHWVMGDANRRDFAIRMQQFFDHFLMDAPEPVWMAAGVPAVEKGENFGLELLEPEKE